jgi:hypothetical protein
VSSIPSAQQVKKPEARSKRSAEAKTEHDSIRKTKNRIAENYRRPEVQDADNSDEFGIQKEMNM